MHRKLRGSLGFGQNVCSVLSLILIPWFSWMLCPVFWSSVFFLIFCFLKIGRSVAAVWAKPGNVPCMMVYWTHETGGVNFFVFVFLINGFAPSLSILQSGQSTYFQGNVPLSKDIAKFFWYSLYSKLCSYICVSLLVLKLLVVNRLDMHRYFCNSSALDR